ncbi:hypothetical protein O181_098569 [Austropuccinia psidii MF-1]|uniref:Uncharacterized protein n=1 Tax=Austropuccinia psidii MF-1 TaxID=1389203 RepID=A0A9Q3JB15_9BASI|nr:hypothetical protein [Austropuccinia psidii MF-1]
MNSKLTELTESSPSRHQYPTFVVLEFSVDSLHPPWLLLDILILQTYDSYKAVEHAITVSLERGHVAVPGCQLLMSGDIYGVGKMGLLGRSSQLLRHLLLMELQGIPIVSNLDTFIKIGTDILDVVTSSRKRDVARWTNVGGQIPVGGRPIYSSSEVPIFRINTEGVVKRIRRIADSPTDPDDEELPLAKRFQSQAIPSTPRNFQPVLASNPTSLSPASPGPSYARPALNQAVRLSPNQQPRM